MPTIRLSLHLYLPKGAHDDNSSNENEIVPPKVSERSSRSTVAGSARDGDEETTMLSRASECLTNSADEKSAGNSTISSKRPSDSSYEDRAVNSSDPSKRRREGN